MESMGAVWGFEKDKNELMYTTMELELVRKDVMQMKRNEDNMKRLLNDARIEMIKNEETIKRLLQERDEARLQLHNLLNKVMPSIMQSSPIDACPILAIPHPDTPPVYALQGNTCVAESDSRSNTYNHRSYDSSIQGNLNVAESDSRSDTYNHHSYGSSHVDSFLGGSSPELSNMNMADSSNMSFPPHVFVQENNAVNTTGVVYSGLTEFDEHRASMVINNLVKGKALPEKGNLLQTIIESGPLLQTLLVSGPLPTWRNPPSVKSLEIPPFSVIGSGPQMINKNMVSTPNYPVQNSLSSSYAEFSYGPSQLNPISTSLNKHSPSTCLNKWRSVPNAVSGDFMPSSAAVGKRQRCQ